MQREQVKTKDIQDVTKNDVWAFNESEFNNIHCEKNEINYPLPLKIENPFIHFIKEALKEN